MMTFQKGDIIYKIHFIRNEETNTVNQIVDTSVKYTIQSIMNEFYGDWEKGYLSRDTALILAENNTEPEIHVVQSNDTHYAIKTKIHHQLINKN